MRYFIAGSKRSQEGFYYNSGTKYNQYDFRTNLDGDLGKYINIGLGILGRYEDRNFPSRSVADIFRSVARGKPTLPAYWPNGLPGPDIEYGDNPVVISTRATGYDQAKTLVLNTNFKLDIKIPWVKGLSVTGNAAIDKGYVFRKIWNTPWFLYTWDGLTLDPNGNPSLLKSKKGFDAPRLEQRFGDGGSTLINGLINYQTTIADNHNLTLLVGVEKITGDTLSFTASRRNFVSPSVDQLFAGAQDNFLANNGTGSNRARLNYFGRVNYTFKEKFLAEFVWRYQGSYIFEESSRYGFFPGVSLGYVISQENFWKSNLAFVEYFKIRASWGQTGNDLIAPYQFLTVFKSPTFLNNPTGSQLSFNDGERLNLALAEDVLSNQNTSWEVATQRNIGIDADLLDSKISITADYFSNLRDDILWQRNASVPNSAGVTLPRENIGKTENKGFDFSINYRNTAGKFSYQVGLNGGYSKNKIVFWDEAPGAPDYQRSTGAPIGAQIYYQAIGIFQTVDEVNNYPHFNGARPGDIIFADVNEDGVINGDDRVRSQKTNIPKWQGGLTATLKFGGFDLSILIQGAAGAETYVFTESGTIGNYLKSFVDNHWTAENPSTTTPRAYERANQYWASQQNTHWLRNTNYVRLKNIELGYSIPSNILGKVKMQNARIYVNAFNLLTHSPDMKDFDPEMTQTPGAAGATYPIQKIINMGISLTF
jgi:TonB-linked SusC/RagA family outer membrane protein